MWVAHRSEPDNGALDPSDARLVEKRTHHHGVEHWPPARDGREVLITRHPVRAR